MCEKRDRMFDIDKHKVHDQKTQVEIRLRENKIKNFTFFFRGESKEHPNFFESLPKLYSLIADCCAKRIIAQSLESYYL